MRKSLLLDHIVSSINEEIHIANDIVEEAKRLSAYIIGDLKNSEKHVNGLISYKEHSFVYKVFDANINVYYRVYTAGIKATKSELVSRIDYKDDINVYFNLAMHNGQPIESYFNDSIWHELTHLYEYIKCKKETLLNKSEFAIYNSIKNVLLLKNNEDQCIFANALYISFKFEQDAMLHGLYRTIISQPYRNSKSIFDNSIELDYLYDLKWSIDNIDLFPNIFCISKNKALLRFKKAIKRYETRLYDVYIKAKEDSQKILIIMNWYENIKSNKSRVSIEL